MKTLTIRDFRTHSKAVREAIDEAGEAVLTVHGKPVAVMLSVGDDFEETLRLIERVRGQRALSALRAAARDAGTDRLTSDEIESIVTRTRRERRQRQAG